MKLSISIIMIIFLSSCSGLSEYLPSFNCEVTPNETITNLQIQEQEIIPTLCCPNKQKKPSYQSYEGRNPPLIDAML